MAYDLAEDHKAIKESIKKWELEIDAIVKKYRDTNKGNQYEGIVKQMGDELEGITEEMMAINL